MDSFKKDYSNATLFGSFINYLVLIFNLFITIPILIIFFNINNVFVCLLILGFIDSFILIPIVGKILNKNCLNNDIEKCKKCNNWNCTRLNQKRDLN